MRPPFAVINPDTVILEELILPFTVKVCPDGIVRPAFAVINPVLVVIEPHVIAVLPVSYTHLTLPTIYSV